MTAFGFCRRMTFAGVFALASCKSSEPVVATSVTAVDSAGVQIVQNHAPIWTDATRWKVDSVPLTTIGGDENDTHQHFRYIRAVLRLSNGNVVIGVENELLLFNKDGKFLRTIARDGNGPGEFNAIGNVWRMTGDSIFASQFIVEGGMKNVLFAPDGSLSREERPDVDQFRALGRWGECDGMVLPDRSRIVCQDDSTIPLSATNRLRTVNADGLASPGPGLLRRLQRQFIVSPSQDTAYRIGITAGGEQFGVSIKGKQYGFFRHPFYARSLTAAGGSPLRIVTMQNPDYEIQVWTPTGKLERTIRRNGRRTPNAQEIKDAAEETLQNAGRAPNGPAFAPQIAAAIQVPDSLPAALAVRVSDAGEILVMREGFLPSQKFSLYDVFNATGNWLGEFRLSRRSYISEVGADYLSVVRYDDDDVPHAEIFRLHK